MISTEFWIKDNGPASYTVAGKCYRKGRRYTATSPREASMAKSEGVFAWIEKIPPAQQPADPVEKIDSDTDGTENEERLADPRDDDPAGPTGLPPEPAPAPAPVPEPPIKKTVQRRAKKVSKE